MDPQFSVVIPAYKAEDRISACIESLVRQDVSRDMWELIIVDDCSPAPSYERLQEVVAGYAGYNISLIRQQVNTRQGGARNTGLRHARGRWVMFMDADDCWVASNVLSQFSKILQAGGVDYCRSTTYTGLNKLPSDVADRDCPMRGEIRTIEDGREIYYTGDMQYGVWSSVYSRDFLMRNNLMFEQDMFYEDSDWNVRMVYASRRCLYIDFPFYGYVNNPESSTNSHSRRLIFDNLRSYQLELDFARRIRQEDPRFYAQIMRSLSHGICLLFTFSRKFKLSDSIPAVKQGREMLEAIEVCGRGASVRRWLLTRMPAPTLAAVRGLTLLKRRVLALKRIFK